MISIEELNALPYPDKIYAIGLKIVGEFTASHKHHLLECGTCKHQWSATPLAKVNAFKKYNNPGCPECTYKKRYGERQTQVKQELEQKGFEILSSGPIRQITTEKVVVRNTKCGHTFETAPGNLVNRDVECPICAREYLNNLNRERNAARHEEWESTASEWEKYESKCRSLTASTYQQFQHIINPNSYVMGIAGTPGAYQLDHIVSVRVGFEKQIPVELICHRDNLQVIPWEVNIKCKTNIKFIPKIFSEWFDCSGMHEFEDEILNMGFVKDINAPYPLCYIKDKISVSLCLFEYYQETTTFRKQVNKKVKEFYADKGIRNIQIYEDEFKRNPTLVFSKITHIIGDSTAKIIHARKCKISVIVDNDLKSRFLNSNHIQGNDNAQLSYGAFYENVLVAIMTFTKPRIFYGKAKYSEGTWELSRFATDVNYRITGIANRLLKQFCNEQQWTHINSYADRRWSDGNMYDKLGFTQVHMNPPGYFYIVSGERKHRWNYRKDVLKTWDNYAPNKTEFAMTAEKGIPRIWDCGTILYQLSKQYNTQNAASSVVEVLDD